MCVVSGVFVSLVCLCMWGECAVCICVYWLGVLLCGLRVCGVCGGVCSVVCEVSCVCTFVWCV